MVVIFSGIDGGKKLGVEPIMKAKDMADQNVEHLGVMAYAAYFQWVKPRPLASEQIIVHIDSTFARVHQPVNPNIPRFITLFMFLFILICQFFLFHFSDSLPARNDNERCKYEGSAWRSHFSLGTSRMQIQLEWNVRQRHIRTNGSWNAQGNHNFTYYKIYQNV